MTLIYIALAWLAGIWLAAHLDFAEARGIWALLALALFALCWISARRRLGRARLLCLALLALPLGALRYSAWPQGDAVAALAGRGGITLLGVVVSEPATRGTTTQFQLSVDAYLRDGERVPIRGRVWVRARQEVTFGYGDYVRAGGALMLPPEIDAFSYADYLARQGMFSVLTSAHVQRLAGGYGNRLRAGLVELRRGAAARVSNYLPEPEAGLLAGILLGDESGISAPVYDAFAQVGAAHIIAISGFNMTLLSGLLAAFLQRLGIGRSRLLWLLLLWMALYTMLVGASPAVMRAALMSALLVLGYALEQRVHVLSSLAASVLLLTLQNPTLLWDIGFQLSASGVLGIGFCISTRPWQHLLPAPRRHTFGLRQLWWSTWRLFRSVLLVTLAASLFTMPLAAAHFGHVSPWWLLVNLFVIPAQGATLILGMLATFCSFIAPPLATVCFWFAFVPLRWTIAVVRTFAEFPQARFDFTLSSTVLGLWFVFMFAIMLFSTAEPRRWRQWRRWLGQRWLFTLAGAAALLLLVLLWLRWQSRPDGQLHLWFLDLGNSNGVLVQMPSGAQLLIDGGRYPERFLTQIGDRMPFYDRRIEAIILTQPDEWDVAALAAVLRRYDVGLVASNGQPIASAVLSELEEELASHPPVHLTAGYTLRFDEEVLVEVLHPRQAPARADSLDDGALVLRLQYGDVSFLLTGDSSPDAQASWLPELAPVTVLQLPQHGATRSQHEELLAQAAAQYYALGADAAVFGFGPDVDVLAALPKDKLFRTDEMGVLHFRTDGQRLEVVGQE